MEDGTTDKISIRKLSENCIYNEEQLRNLDPKFKYFRIVEKGDFFFAVAFAYFEILAKLKNQWIIQKNLELNEIVERIGNEDISGKRFIQRLLQDLKLQTLEIIKNDFRFGKIFFQKIMKVYYGEHQGRRNFEFLDIFDRAMMKKKFWISGEIEIDDSFAKLAASAIGTCIIVYSIGQTRIMESKNIPVRFQIKNFEINLLKDQDNNYILLYPKKTEGFFNGFTLIGSEPPKPFYNCLLCYYVENTLKSECGHHYHLDCITKQNLEICKACHGQIRPLVGHCHICDTEKKIIFEDSENHPICSNCLITAAQSISTIESPKYISENYSISLCEKKISCPNCKIPRFLFDFVPVSCPDNHDFLCKKCWGDSSLGLELEIYNYSNQTCPYNSKPINITRSIINQFLRLRCENCKCHKTSIFREKICEDNCKICSICQEENNQKDLASCRKCKNTLLPKTGPWK